VYTSLVFAAGAVLTGLSSLALSTFTAAVATITTLYVTLLGSTLSRVQKIYTSSIDALAVITPNILVGSDSWVFTPGIAGSLLTVDRVSSRLLGASDVISIGTGSSDFYATSSSLDVPNLFASTRSAAREFAVDVSSGTQVSVIRGATTMPFIGNQLTFGSNATYAGGTTSDTNLVYADQAYPTNALTQPFSTIGLASKPYASGFFNTLVAPKTYQAVFRGNTSTSSTITAVAGYPVMFATGYLNSLTTNNIAFNISPSASTYVFTEGGLYNVTISVAVGVPTSSGNWLLQFTGRYDGITSLYVGPTPQTCINSIFSYSFMARFNAGGSVSFSLAPNAYPFSYTVFYAPDQTYLVFNRIL